MCLFYSEARRVLIDLASLLTGLNKANSVEDLIFCLTFFFLYVLLKSTQTTFLFLLLLSCSICLPQSLCLFLSSACSGISCIQYLPLCLIKLAHVALLHYFAHTNTLVHEGPYRLNQSFAYLFLPHTTPGLMKKHEPC